MFAFSKTIQTVKEKIEHVFKGETEKALNILQRLKDIQEGKQDIKNRIQLILNPDTPETSTKLSTSQIDFVCLSYMLGSWYPEFIPLKKFAEEFCKVNLSHEAIGLQSAIQLNQAFNDNRLLSKFGVNLTPKTEPMKE